MKPKIIILFIFQLFLPTLLLSQLNIYDVFPLEVGMKRTYFFNSYDYKFEIPMPTYHRSDTGIVKFEIFDKTENDTSISWKVKEMDSLKIIKFCFSCSDLNLPFQTKDIDTTYIYKDTICFDIIEMKTSNHQLISNSNYPIWRFPKINFSFLEDFDSNILFSRYCDTGKRISFSGQVFNLPYECKYSFLFQDKFGLYKIFCKTTKSTPFASSSWSAELLDPLVGIKEKKTKFLINIYYLKIIPTHLILERQ